MEADTEAALEHARRLGPPGVISKNLTILRRLVVEQRSGAVERVTALT